MDTASISIICISAIFVIATLFYFALGFIEIFQGKRKFKGHGIKGFCGFIFAVLALMSIGYCLYHIPDILFERGTWAFLEAQGPISIVYAGISLSVAIPIFYIYLVFSLYFTNPNEVPYFALAGLSIISGLGNSLIIFTINNAVGRNDRVESGLYFYLIVGVAIFAASSIISRKKLIIYTNQLVYSKRIEIIDKILQMPFEKFEASEDGSLHAALNNDTEIISGFVNILISGLTSVISIICCLVYLGFLNIYGLFFSTVVIVIAAAAFYIASISANKSWEKTRDIQNIFFKYIDDLVRGFKELYLNKGKSVEFRKDMHDTCDNYRKTRIEGDFKFVNVTVMGELLFTSVIGIVVFIFPLLFSSIENDTLNSYVFVFLYMAGSVNVLLYAMPNIVKIIISWKRINHILKEISYDSQSLQSIEYAGHNKRISLELTNIEYEYKNKDDEVFSVGPVSCSFQSGEVIFITGGNGSGKSTLAKLITGLYTPSKGDITVNGNKKQAFELGKYFSAVFSDFYLFEKLYGVDSLGKKSEIVKQLQTLHMQGKVEIIDGAFSTTKLSTGQRKRLALMICYLEDKPICVFDEWAADQDPEFREFFYKVILPELKNRGKCIIAITHDDRYFHLADKVIKMESGKVIEAKEIQSSIKLDLANA